MYKIFVWKNEKLPNTVFQRMFLFRFLLVLLIVIPNNTPHLMFYTYICYWNTFQYKYIVQITFHAVKQSHVRVTSKLICFLFIMFFAYFRFIFTSFYFIKLSSSLVV